tara:strand:+ start:240 stop:503 length:264 start_codon:yes stop_codon:yes gene_type:complete
MARKEKTAKNTVKKTDEPTPSWFKRTFNVIKNWIVGNGIEGILGLVSGLILWFFGFKIYAGFAFGVFATRNWDLAKSEILKLINKLK